MRTKRSQSVFRVLYAFGTEASSRRNWKLGRMKMEWWTFIFAKFLNNDLKKCWQNRLKACFECSVPSVQKPLFAGTWSSEAWKSIGQHLFLPNFWRMIFEEMLTKPSQKWALSALCLRYRNHFSPELEARNNGIGMVNIYCSQIFEQWCEEMLTKPSQSETPVLYAFGTETTFGRN